MRSAEHCGWDEKARRILLTLFFASLCLPIAIQQSVLGLVLAFFLYTIVRNSGFQLPGFNSERQKPEYLKVNLSQRFSSAIRSFSTPLDRPLLVFFAALLLSTLWSPDVLNSLTGYRKLWLLGAFFATYHLLRGPGEAWRLMTVMLGVAAVIAAYGIVQHFTGIDWSRELLGKERELDAFWFGRQEGFRTKGLHPSGITYAHNLLFPLTFISVVLFSPSLSWRRWWVVAIGWGLMAFALLFSLTRGVWVAYVAVLLLLALLRRGRTVLCVGAGALLLSVFLLSAGTGVWDRFVSTFSPVANISRGFIWQANVDMATDRPLLGWGYGNYKKFRDPYYRQYPWANSSAHAHNNFLQMWVDTGLLGLAAFLALFVMILRKAWQTYRHAQEPAKTLALGAFLAVIGFLIGGLTQYNFGDAEVVLVLWATAGMVLRLHRWVMSDEPPAVS